MSEGTSARRIGVFLTLLLLLAPAIATAQAGEPDEGRRENVRLTFRAGRIEDGARKLVKSYDLIVEAGSSGSTLLSGERVPIPVNEATDESDDAGGRRLVYQNIGFTIVAEVRLLGGDRIELVANLEDSRVREDDGGGPPTVETKQLRVNAILAPGRPLELTRVENVEGASGYVEVEAQVLR